MDIRQCLCDSDYHLQDDMVLQINKDMIDDFCAHSTETDRFHALFNLQKEYMSLQSKHKKAAAAHISYLISYYLSIATTLPRAEDLRHYYANAAVDLNPCELYRDWLSTTDG